jgi:hypothetical protein
VVLDHVAQAPGGFVEGTSSLHPELLGQGDLDAGDVVPVPDRFEERVGETEVQEVHAFLFAEEVIDAEDRRFRERGAHDAVEFACRGEIAAERLLDDDACVVVQPGAGEPFDHCREQRRGNGEVVRGAARPAKYPPERVERAVVGVVTVDVVQPRQEPVEGLTVVDAGVSVGDAVAGPVAKLRQIPP